ncbi:MAG: YbaK/EbsC family protein [Alphaproteobacteria bacterium]|jgi:Ala-tRNA(Pro) deacylase
MPIATSLQKYLAEKGAEYEVVTHTPTVSASRTAQVSHVPGDRIAKAVVLKSDDGYLLAVLPASHHIQLGELQRWLNRPIGLATEDEAAALFSDCQLGAFPATGGAYGLEVVMDDSLSAQPDIYFEGGDHASLVHVSAEQFKELMAGAKEGRFSHHD